MSKTDSKSTVLLKHHLKALKLPVMHAECEKIAQRCAADNADHLAFLLQLSELELIERERKAAERRLKAARFAAPKPLDEFDFSARPSINKPLLLQLVKGEYLDKRGLCNATADHELSVKRVLRRSAGTITWRRASFKTLSLASEVIYGRKARRQGGWRRASMAARSTLSEEADQIALQGPGRGRTRISPMNLFSSQRLRAAYSAGAPGLHDMTQQYGDQADERPRHGARYRSVKRIAQDPEPADAWVAAEAGEQPREAVVGLRLGDRHRPTPR